MCFHTFFIVTNPNNGVINVKSLYSASGQWPVELFFCYEVLCGNEDFLTMCINNSMFIDYVLEQQCGITEKNANANNKRQ